jgi:hypothetical protein
MQMAEHKIPGGRDKDKLLTEASPEGIKWWLDKKRDELAADPDGKWASNNKAWIAAAEAELARRSGGGQPKQSAAPRQPAPTQAIQRAPGDIQVLGRAMHDPQAVTAKLNELSASYHMVSPATRVDGLPAGCGIAISYVTVDANDAKDGPGEVYSVGGGKLGLSATTLSKIGAAAGISWDPQQSGRLDNGSDPHYCHFRAVGVARNFDGSVRVLTGEVEIDARDGSPQIDEIRKKAEDRRRENPTWKNDGGDAQILELRKFLLRHAERKAKSRAIADLGVKRSYTKAELTKPFAVARIMFTGETEDPELRKALALKTADAMLGGMASLYGGQAPAQQPPPAPHPAAAPLPAPQFQGHAPPPLMPRQTHDVESEPESQPYGPPTAEELAASDAEGGY